MDVTKRETDAPITADSSEEQKLNSLRALRGILKWDGPPPTDEEIEEERYRHLVEKYS